MEILKAPLFFMNNIKKKENQKSRETHARISQKDFTATDGRTENSQKISLFGNFCFFRYKLAFKTLDDTIKNALTLCYATVHAKLLLGH
jgi:hypothetical protein